MARGVFGGVEFETTTGKIAAREAKRNAAVREAYIEQQQQHGKPVLNWIKQKAHSQREFVAWDGEGYTDADGVHHYMMFGASTGDIIYGGSLGTLECFDLMLRVEAANPNAYHVWFAGNYDVNMIFRDMPRE